MRVTLRLDDDLLADIRALAVQNGVSLAEFVEASLRETLRRTAGEKRESITLTTFGGSGVLPGVDINNSAALLDIMEGRTPLEHY